MLKSLLSLFRKNETQELSNETISNRTEKTISKDAETEKNTPIRSTYKTVTITIPKLSENANTQYTVSKWIVKDGTKVENGQIIAEIETDKLTMEFEVYDSGTLEIIAQEKSILKVDEVIAKIHR